MPNPGRNSLFEINNSKLQHEVVGQNISEADRLFTVLFSKNNGPDVILGVNLELDCFLAACRRNITKFLSVFLLGSPNEGRCQLLTMGGEPNHTLGRSGSSIFLSASFFIGYKDNVFYWKHFSNFLIKHMTAPVHPSSCLLIFYWI